MSLGILNNDDPEKLASIPEQHEVVASLLLPEVAFCTSRVGFPKDILYEEAKEHVRQHVVEGVLYLSERKYPAKDDDPWSVRAYKVKFEIRLEEGEG